MKNTNEIENSIRSGEIISAENSHSSVELFYFDAGNRNAWATGFKIRFNGLWVYTSKTFAPANKFFSKLIKLHNLNLNEK